MAYGDSLTVVNSRGETHQYKVAGSFQVQDMTRYMMPVITLLVAAFGIYNILSIVINQKKREIAILRYIGINTRLLNLPENIDDRYYPRAGIMSIRLENVVKSFGEPPVEVIQRISFDLKDGEFVSLTGKSGSGKSTLLYTVSSLDLPKSGRVLIQDKDVAQLDQRELHRFRNEQIGFVCQYHYLLPEFSALENVLMPALKVGRLAEKGRKPLNS